MYDQNIFNVLILGLNQIAILIFMLWVIKLLIMFTLHLFFKMMINLLHTFWPLLAFP